MIQDTNYETGSDPGTGLTEYMGNDHEIRDASGRKLDDDEIEQFNEKCAKNGFSRQIVLSPDRTDLDEQELDKAARRTMNELTEGHNSTEYLYSVHEDTEHSHVHIAATASQDSGEMWLEKDDLRELQDEIAADHFRDHTTERQERLMQEQGREQELQQEQAERELADQDQEPDPGDLLDLSPDRDDDQEQEREGIDPSLAFSVAGEMASSSPETMPASIMLEAYRERQRDRQQERDRQQDHQHRNHNRNR
jgi:hypothetical protein